MLFRPFRRESSFDRGTRGDAKVRRFLEEHHDVQHRRLLYGRAIGPNGCQFSVRMRIEGPCLAHRRPRGRTSVSARDISSTSKRLLSINQASEFFPSPSSPSLFPGQSIRSRIHSQSPFPRLSFVLTRCASMCKSREVFLRVHRVYLSNVRFRFPRLVSIFFLMMW